MYKKILYILLMTAMSYSTSLAQITPITGTDFDNLNLSSLSCDETKTNHYYKNDYVIIWDHFKNTQSYDLYLRKYKTYTSTNYFLYNPTDTDKDSSSIVVFNRPELIPVAGKVSPGQEVRHLTTAEEYTDKYGATDNAKFVYTPNWTFSGSVVTDSLDGYSFGNPNARNIRTPANNNPTISPNYDDIVKFATLYDTDKNTNTSNDNVALIQCQELIVRWCGDGRLGFTGNDGLAGTSDDEEYGGDIYHGEQCDDGNTNNNDGCSSTCKLETPNVTITVTPSSSTAAFDGVLDSTKSSRSDYVQLNDGLGNISTGSGISFPVSKHYTGSANPTISVISNYSGLINPNYSLPGNNASATVYIGSDGGGGGGGGGGGTGVCGDSVINTPNSSGIFETCDDGNTTSGDGCSSICENETGGGGGGGGTGVCGDSVINTPNSSGIFENCDDGNTTSGDGCSSTCSSEGGGGGGGGGVCSNGIIEASESCETHQYIFHSQMCGTGTGAYDCSYTSLDFSPTVPGCRASDCRYCGDNTLEDSQGEECDNTQSWCTGSCDINYGDPTGPGGTGTDIIYDPKKLIGNDQPVYPGGTDKPKLKNVSGYPIYINKEFCIDRFYQKNNLGNSFYPRESLNFNGLPVGYCEGPVGLLLPNDFYYGLENATDDWTGRIDDFNNVEKYVDNQIIAWLDENGDRNLQSQEPKAEKIIRVSIPSVSTIGGGTSMVDSNNKGDLNALASDGISDQSKNNNFIVSSLQSTTSTTTPLSSYTIESEEGVIKTQAIVEGDNDISSFDSLAITSSTSTFYGISSFDNYNGLSNVYYKRGNVILNTTNITGGNKTFIVDGNLTINGNITSNDSIAFVVKGGLLTIGNLVTKIDGVYISMEDKIKGDGIQTFNKLLVTGALYGNIDDLVSDRTFINDNGNGLIDVGTVVHYTSKVYTTPPPLLGDFIGQYMEVRKISTDR